MHRTPQLYQLYFESECYFLNETVTSFIGYQHHPNCTNPNLAVGSSLQIRVSQTIKNACCKMVGWGTLYSTKIKSPLNIQEVLLQFFLLTFLRGFCLFKLVSVFLSFEQAIISNWKEIILKHHKI